MKHFLFFAILSSLIFGCKEDGIQSSADLNTREVYSISINDVLIADRSITLNVSCEVPDPSWAFSHFNVVTNGKTIDLTVYAKQVNSVAPAVLALFKKGITIPVQKPGTYTIHYKTNYDLNPKKYTVS